MQKNLNFFSGILTFLEFNKNLRLATGAAGWDHVIVGVSMGFSDSDGNFRWRYLERCKEQQYVCSFWCWYQENIQEALRIWSYELGKYAY